MTKLISLKDKLHTKTIHFCIDKIDDAGGKTGLRLLVHNQLHTTSFVPLVIFLNTSMRMEIYDEWNQ